MNIHFFEEFPTKENISKLKLITWPCKLFLAAHSVKEFKALEKHCTTIKKDISLVYWPVLQKDEGYWISPFASHAALKRIFSELEKHPVPTMLDLELPFRKPSRFITGFFDYFRNKRLINACIGNAKEVYTCENALGNTILPSCNGKPHKRIIMFYSSMLQKRHARWFIEHGIMNHLKDKENLIVALGTIATGILGNEPLLTPENLKKDIEEMKKLGIREVVIFRLGGLNQGYKKVIKSFCPE